MRINRFHDENLAKHGVSRMEVEECLRLCKTKYLQRVRRGANRVIAQTGAGRYLEVVYRESPQVRYIFHAMDARPWQIKLFKRRGKRS